MNTAINIQDNQHQHLMGNRILLFVSYFLNIGALFSHINPIIKALLLIMTVLTTVMAFFNQYKTFKKNFRTWYIVVTINRVVSYMVPKKVRHRGISINKQKHKSNEKFTSEHPE